MGNAYGGSVKLKIGFISLGCPKNLVDSEVMLGLSRQAGHTLTRDPSEADVVVVNTCAFIDSAKQESIDAILEMAARKRDGRMWLVVTGCLAERYGDALRHEIPEIDVVLGIDGVPDIVDAIGGCVTGLKPGGPTSDSAGPAGVPSTVLRAGSQEAVRKAAVGLPGFSQGAVPVQLVRKRPTYIYDANTPRVLTTPRHFAYVKIAEGCDYKCAFCIIPTLRGAYRSRPADSIVDEAKRLAQQGVRELILISQDTTFYGVDKGERGALPRLLDRLNRVDGLDWIRLLYLYPTTVDDGVLEAMAQCEKVCKYVDLPLQHASAAVLKRMKRPGTGATYRRLLERVRARVPGVALRTTFIVGFPGETPQDFDELQAFARDVQFDHLGVFTYSHEEGTTAFGMADDVPARTKRARQRDLMSGQRARVEKRNRGRVGEPVRVLVDGPSEEHVLVLKGRLESQAPEIDSAIYLGDCDPAQIAPGTFVEATIVEARGYDLVARPAFARPATGGG
jgi:ribosomal protein S12 methylthiotransferase